MIAMLLTVALAAPGPAVGDALPWFAGWTAHDRVFNRDALLARPARGHALVFFATWCAPCEQGLKTLSKAGLAKKGVELTVIACGQSPAEVAPWLAARGLGGLRVVYDRFGQIARDLGVEQRSGAAQSMRLPRVMVVHRSGVVAAVLDGEAAHDPALITAALSHPVKAPAAPPPPAPAP